MLGNVRKRRELFLGSCQHSLTFTLCSGTVLTWPGKPSLYPTGPRRSSTNTSVRTIGSGRAIRPIPTKAASIGASSATVGSSVTAPLRIWRLWLCDPGQGERARAAAPGVEPCPVDLIGTGDYQAAEKKFGLSRKMLEVCLELGFPVFVLERSPLVLRDLDLLQDINERAAVVAFSIISTPDSPHYDRVREMETLRRPPGSVSRRCKRLPMPAS